MKLQQLRFILAIADCDLNITQASQHLYTSQPGVSKQLRLLEEELGIQIFVRNGRSLSGITQQGQVVLEKARQVMQTVDEIKNYSRESSRLKKYVPIQKYSACA